ncbi:hypothetical protein GLOIN_2v1603025 [Rhizophagus irregularis DAOM 181602=DAOM 197198]|nr:hypothetical protein GLOIN_2v1603025 [Rhizophagus irregularis DAOM 181602=DAOM 197198]CAB4392434.1 unnamed protein product [Rhizophagus irregularis]CAB5187542.1 unnamed protein product [Rhizophagus irregularis]CAB5345773.1 unnamed protein product [Rhizophagus irregularis]
MDIIIFYNMKNYMYIMTKSSQLRFFFINLIILSLSQITYSVPINRNRGWVFWYYSNNGQTRDCANYCILTFSIVGVIILLLILCGLLSCYRIKRQALKDGYPSFKSYSFFSKEMDNNETNGNEKNDKSNNSKKGKKSGKGGRRSDSMSEVLTSS